MSENSKKTTVEKVKKIFDNNWNRQVILFGPPGTSKTYASTIIAASIISGAIKSYEEAKDFLEGNKQYELVQFHPSYSYEDFVRGITVKPVTGGTGVTYEVEPKRFEEFCDRAREANAEDKYVMVIDEINRAPLASVLGELIYGLEYRGSSISTPYKKLEEKTQEDKPLIIPENLYIIGTMNTADRSIGSIDYAVRRRFAFVHVPSEQSKIKDSWEHIGEDVESLYEMLMKDSENGIFANGLLEDLEMDVEDIKIGHTYFLGKKKGDSQGNGTGKPSEEDERAYMDYRIEYQIKPIYMEYIKDGLIKKEGKDKFEGIIDKWRAREEEQSKPESK